MTTTHLFQFAMSAALILFVFFNKNSTLNGIDRIWPLMITSIILNELWISVKFYDTIVHVFVQVSKRVAKKKYTTRCQKHPPIAGLEKSTYLPTIIWLEIRRILCFKASSTKFQKFQIENIASQK